MPTKVTPTSPQRVGAWQCRIGAPSRFTSTRRRGRAPGSLVALDVVLRHLVQLGLRSPSEQTQAMLAALCVLRDLRDDSSSSKQIPDAMKLRSIFLNVKARVHTSMFKAKQDGDQMLPHGHLVALPANPKDAPAGLLSLAFPDGYESESDSAPFSLMDLANVAREISLRSTNSKVVQADHD